MNFVPIGIISVSIPFFSFFAISFEMDDTHEKNDLQLDEIDWNMNVYCAVIFCFKLKKKASQMSVSVCECSADMIDRHP